MSFKKKKRWGHNSGLWGLKLMPLATPLKKQKKVQQKEKTRGKRTARIALGNIWSARSYTDINTVKSCPWVC